MAATLAAALVGLLLTEAGVRVFGVAPPPTPKSVGQPFRFTEDKKLLYENRPGATFRITYLMRAGDEPRVVEHRINEQGLRGPVVALPKPEGVFRIACVGDSHTFGEGVEEGRTWPAQLGLLLGAEADAVEVLNCGVDGYNTEQEVLWIEKRGVGFEPDLVVLQYFINDTASRDPEVQEGAPRDWLAEICHPRRQGTVGWLRVHVRVLDLVMDGVYRKRWLRSWAIQRSHHYRDGSPGWRQVRASLLRARDFLRARGTGFAVVLYPMMVRDGEHLASHAALAEVAGFCDGEGIPCLDTEPFFLDREVERLLLHPHDLHAGAEAHRIFARATADWLLSEGLVPKGN